MPFVIIIAVGAVALYLVSRTAQAMPLDTFNGDASGSFFPPMPALDALSSDAPLDLPPLLDPSMTARGIRNNNPGNIRYNAAVHWQGQVGSDGAFVIFDTPASGLRALGIILHNYQVRYGLNTVRGIVSRYAPPSENNTAAYIAGVAAALGVGPDTPIDTGNGQTLTALMTAIITHENGTQPYDGGSIAAGAAAAIVA
jgi:hypothetical protein